jgi:hypothetical protein
MCCYALWKEVGGIGLGNCNLLFRQVAVAAPKNLYTSAADEGESGDFVRATACL